MENEKKNSRIRGVVTDCLWAPITESPNPPNDENCIISSLSALTEVTVDLSESTDNYYKVYTSSGVSGFCPKKRIALAREDDTDG